MTTRRVSGAHGPEGLEVGDDVVDLRRGEGPLEGADRPAVDENLRHGAAARAAHEIGACLGVAAHVDLVEGDAARPQQPLRAHAERAARRGVHLDARHRVEARPRAPASQALTARRPADTVARWPIRASPRRSRAWWT